MSSSFAALLLSLFSPQNCTVVFFFANFLVIYGIFFSKSRILLLYKETFFGIDGKFSRTVIHLLQFYVTFFAFFEIAFTTVFCYFFNKNFSRSFALLLKISCRKWQPTFSVPAKIASYMTFTRKLSSLRDELCASTVC